MTRRAFLLLDALADGPLSRSSIFERIGFHLLNNAAAELRAAGYPVVCTKLDGEYFYEVVGGLDDAHRSVTPHGGQIPPVRVIEAVCDDSGQLVLGGVA